MNKQHKKVLILGGHGMLGNDVVKVFPSSIALGRNDCDITQYDSVRACIDTHSPDLIINCAAYTKVDLAETEQDQAFAINSVGPQNIATVCAEKNIELMHISTDYVFDGTQEEPYLESDICNPLSTYGKSKWKGEESILAIYPQAKIVRTQWLYGLGGKNFVETMLHLAKTRDSLSVIHDQIGSPTYTADLAKALLQLSYFSHSGIFHIHNEGFASWYEFAKEIFFQSNSTCHVEPIPTTAYPLPAKRPQYGTLSMNRWQNELNCSPLPHWKDALKRYLLARQ